MLTHEVDIAFSPQSRVGSLAVSDDGKIIAWSESNQSVNILVGNGKAQKISIDSDAKGIFFQDDNLIYADDDFNASQMCCVCGGGDSENESNTGGDNGSNSGNGDEVGCSDTNNGATNMFDYDCSPPLILSVFHLGSSQQ